MDDLALAADIGGTNARFALVRLSPGGARIVFRRTWPTASFPDFEPAMAQFLREARAEGFATGALHAAVAMAGPVDADAGRLTNQSWTLDRRALQAELGIAARLVNDFQALAHGVAHIEHGDFIELQAGESASHGTIALVGAGTGLGVASLAWDGARYRPVPSEGGHISFAPADEQQVELLRFVFRRHRRVSAERVVSGDGLRRIYEFIANEKKDPAEISERAIAAPGSLEGKALGLFIRCYGAFAGDVALAFLARGGVYICGGIAAKLAGRFRQGDFIAAFNDKGRHAPLVQSIPLRLVVNEDLGLLGAAYAAAAP